MKVLSKQILYVFSLALLLVSFNSINLLSAELIGDNPEAIELLSKCLKETKATMYGTANCGHCNKQKEMFGPYFRNIRFVDCRSSAANQRECNETKVGKFPQWQFENGNTIVREANLDTIARASSCDSYVAQALGNTNYTASTNNNYKKASETVQTTTTKESYTSNNSSGDYGTPEELAKCLKDKGVMFYGSPRCSHCDKQKALFEGSFEKYLSSNFHNCKGSASEQAECSAKKTFPFPTWIDPSSGKKLLGPERPLQEIARAFNCNGYSSASSQQNSSQVEAASNVVQNNSSEDSWGQREIKDELNDIKNDLNKMPEGQDDLNKSQNDQASSQTVASASTPSYFDAGKSEIEFKQNKLASCIANRNIILYGITNPEQGKPIQYKATQQQLNELGAAANQIKVVDCSANQAECSGILVYPTWILDDKKELAGVYEFSNLAQILGCSIDAQ